MKTDKIPKNKFAFVVHETKKTPKYFEINKSLFKFFIIVLPLLSLLSLAAISAGLIYFKSINDILKRQESGTVKSLREKNSGLLKSFTNLQDHNSELEKRLATKKIKTLDVLNLVKFTPGQLDKSRFSTISIENSQQKKEFTPLFDSKQVHLKFNLNNLSPTKERHSGFLFVVMKSSDLIQVYPKNSFADEGMHIVFNRGEIFGFNNLRPVRAIFDLPAKRNKLSFKVLLFNKLGDLIHEDNILYEEKGN